MLAGTHCRVGGGWRVFEPAAEGMSTDEREAGVAAGEAAGVVAVTIGVPVERVWHALRDRAELRRWHGWDADTLDAEIEQIYFTDATADDRTHTLDLGGTEVTVTPGTTVTFRMTAPPEDPLWGGWYDAIVEGWVTFAQQLRYALERHPGEDRISRYVEGPQVFPAVREPGHRYEAGDLTGEVWFRSAHQLGLTVDAWGAGLLVLQENAAVLTGYGVPPTGWSGA